MTARLLPGGHSTTTSLLPGGCPPATRLFVARRLSDYYPSVTRLLPACCLLC